MIVHPDTAIANVLEREVAHDIGRVDARSPENRESIERSAIGDGDAFGLDPFRRGLELDLNPVPFEEAVDVRGMFWPRRRDDAIASLQDHDRNIVALETGIAGEER